MHQFFINQNHIKDSDIQITGEDVNHIKNVLRLKAGEKISLVSDDSNREYICEIISVTETSIHTHIVDIVGVTRELPVKITLYQSLPKGDKMELIIQKCVELGVSKIVPVQTARTIVKWNEKKAQDKVRRYQAISLSAAKQAKRSILPEISNIFTYEEALQDAVHLDMNLIPYEQAKGMADTKAILEQVKTKGSVGIFIGPEGGFEEKEIKSAKKAGIYPITLGHRILRTETAGMAMLSILMFMLEED